MLSGWLRVSEQASQKMVGCFGKVRAVSARFISPFLDHPSLEVREAIMRAAIDSNEDYEDIQNEGDIECC